MAKKKPHFADGWVMSGVTTSAATPWGESVHPEGKIVVFDMWCKKCGICVEFCPTGALANRADKVPYLAEPDKCTLCGLCWLRCPDMAIIKGPELLENEPAEREAELTRKLLCDAGAEESCKLPEEPKKEVAEAKNNKKKPNKKTTKPAEKPAKAEKGANPNG